MRNRLMVRVALALALLVGPLLLAGRTWAADEQPTVKRLGKTVARYRDRNILVAVSWKYPNLHPEEAWTFFETWIMPVVGGTEINREDVSLFLPDGTRLNLPSQNKVAEGFPDIRRVLGVGEISRDPIEGYFIARRSLVRIGFQEVPGTFLTYDLRGLAPYDCAYGDLFWQHPKGSWEKGIYTLAIQHTGLDVKIPMPIGIEGELERIK